ncbi:MAG: hypothetical protein GXY09_10915 [Bacteroidales bacterium]|nr:hypothetical protein [Bacteroidales bacterium]
MKKIVSLSFMALVLAGLFAGCEETDDGGDNTDEVITAINGQILTPTVWENGTVKIIDCILNVQSTLTLEPGCTLQFTENGGLEIGTGTNAALIADGTPEKPITFTTVTAANGQAGSWYGISFGTNNVIATTVLNNCIIEGAGKNADPVIEVYNTKIAMDSCTLRNGAGVGIRLMGSTAGFTSFTHNNLSNCFDYLLSGEVQPLLGLDTTNVFTSVVNKTIAIEGGNVNTTGTLKRLSVPYTVLQPIRVDNAELTIQPGTTLRFTNDGTLEIGYTQHAALIAEGEPTRPILFTSASTTPQAGDWSGIYFYSNNSSNKSIIKHAVLDYGGKPNGVYESVITAYSGFKLINSTIRNSKNYGISFDEYSGFTECTNNTIQNCEKDPILITAAFAHTIGAGNTLTALQGMGIHVKDGTVSKNVTWLKQTVPYIMEGVIYVQTTTGTASLTLNPGCDLRFTATSHLEVSENAKLIAIGTPQDSIIFTSNAQTKSPGDWGGINFWQDVSATNELKYCRVDYGADYSEHNIGIYSSKVKITNCAINHSEGCGIYIAYDEPPLSPVIENNTYVGNATGDVLREE